MPRTARTDRPAWPHPALKPAVPEVEATVVEGAVIDALQLLHAQLAGPGPGIQTGIEVARMILEYAKVPQLDVEDVPTLPESQHLSGPVAPDTGLIAAALVGHQVALSPANDPERVYEFKVIGWKLTNQP